MKEEINGFEKGSYDAERKILTLVWGSLPKEKKEYVNSKWGEQDDPFAAELQPENLLFM